MSQWPIVGEWWAASGRTVGGLQALQTLNALGAVGEDVDGGVPNLPYLTLIPAQIHQLIDSCQRQTETLHGLS